MTEVEKTASDILLEAADLLEEENCWGQGNFFNASQNHGCTMCAHGAIAYCSNPVIKEAVKCGNITSAYANLGVLCEPAHVRAFGAGLTFAYNDSNLTTKQDVIDKLREAARIQPTV